jgi:lysophospholipase L1-like esterase
MKVICYGDSNTYGYDPRSYFGDRYDSKNRWVDLLAQKTKWLIRNDGMNGRQIPHHTVSFPSDTHFLFIMLGTNDLLQGYSAREIALRMERFLHSLNFPLNRVILISPPPVVRGAWVERDALVETAYRLVFEFCDLANRLGVKFVNAGEWGIPMCFDGVHFTEEGHKRFADGLYDYLLEEDMVCLKQE